MDNDQTQDVQEKKNLKVNKIKLNLNKQQTAKLNEWFNTFRWTYNKCLEHYNENKQLNIKSLR